MALKRAKKNAGKATTVPAAAGDPPVITSAYGVTTESARRRAAQNMIDDPGVRRRVERLLIKQSGGDRALGLEEFARRYPEVIAADRRKPS